MAATESATARKLNAQIERVLDEGSGRAREVIVQMRGRDRDVASIARAAAQTIEARLMSTSPRALLPPRASAYLRKPESGRLTANQRKELRASDGSFAAQVALLAHRTGAKSRLVHAGLALLEPILTSDYIKGAVVKAIASGLSVKAAANVKPYVTALWAAKSVVINLSVDDLRRLPEEIQNIRNIYSNRTVPVPRVSETEEDLASADGEFGSTWGLRKVGALSTWGAFGGRGEGVLVGLLDTGVDATHPDLAGSVAKWAEFDRSGREVADSKTPRDSDEHGTHCAGTIAGRNSSGRWIGVAPDAKLAAALVLDGANGGTDAQILAGMQWAIDGGVDVISMSLGGLTMNADVPDTYTESIVDAIRLGIPVITAIGNDGNQTTGAPGNDLFAFAVGATDHEDRVAGFSGGRTMILRQSDYVEAKYLPMTYIKPDVSAPGVAVYSSVPGGQYKALNGTSMAAPHVAGAVALLLGNTGIKHNFEGPERAYLITDLITGAVEPLGEAGRDHRHGYGRIDVNRAVGIARNRGY